jgi:hypothetical protein
MLQRAALSTRSLVRLPRLAAFARASVVIRFPRPMAAASSSASISTTAPAATSTSTATAAPTSAAAAAAAGVSVPQSTGPMYDRVVAALLTGLNPTHLEVINESKFHNVPKGSESHFKVPPLSLPCCLVAADRCWVWTWRR